MTRKDYVALAAAIRSRVDMAQSLQGTAQRMTHYTELATTIADTLAADNSAFDRQRFLKAAGVQS